MNSCSKCGEINRLEKHHFLPRVHFGKKNNGHVIMLCHSCHIKAEIIIASVESFVGDKPFGTRHKLSREEYFRIHRHWLKNSKLIHLWVA